MTTDRISGRLVATWSYTQPAEPGWAQHQRHQGEGAPPNHRDDAPTGAGWQPAAWTDSPVVVLDGAPDSHASNHKGTGSHHGDEGRGPGNLWQQLTNRDELRGGDTVQPLLGAGGAANGGLRADGAAPWMARMVTRRRADGGTVVRVPGMRMGKRHIPVKGEHRQGLHLNKPTIRGVRQKQIITSAGGPMPRPAGPIVPKAHAPLAPQTYAEQPTRAQTAVIGSDWVR